MLSILGIVIIIVATFQVYKTAKGTERNAAVWALVTFVVGFGIQIVVPFFIGLILAVVWIASGSTEQEVQATLQTPAIIIGLAGLLLSIVAIALIMRQVAKIPEEKSSSSPPSPPKFD
jgi:hypothetical protein